MHARRRSPGSASSPGVASRAQRVRTIRLRVDGVESIAALAAESAAADALWNALPLRTELFSAIWSGHACTFSPPPALLAAADDAVGADNAVPVGTIAVASRENGGVVVIAYGPTLHHTALGPAPVTRFAEITSGAPQFLARIERIFTEGAVPLEIERA